MAESRPVRILYVDDDSELADLTRQTMEQAGYKLDLACDIEEGLTKHDSGRYKVVIVGPSISSASQEKIRTLSSRAPRPPIVMVAKPGDEQPLAETLRSRPNDRIIDYVIGDVEGRYLHLLPFVVEQVYRQHLLTERNRQTPDMERESEEKPSERHDPNNQQLAALNAVSQAMSSSTELQDVLNQALSHTIQALGFSGGLIALFKAHSKEPTLASTIGLPQPLVEHLTTHGVNDTLCDFAYRDEIPRQKDSLRTDSPAEEHILLKAGFHAYVGTPIVYKKHAMGTLCLLDTTPHAVSESDYALLAMIGQQIGAAVENARLFTDVLRERELARTLLDTAEAVSSTLQLDKLLEHVLDALQRVVPYDAASISLLHSSSSPREGYTEDRGPIAWVVASRGLEHLPSRRLALETFPLMHRVVDKRQPIIVPDTESEPDWLPMEGRELARSWLGMPLISKGRVIGILTIDSCHPDTYNTDAVRLAFAFANQAALAIDNSRMYEQTRTHLDEALLLHSVTAALSSTLDTDQLLPYVARSLCEALHSTSTEIYSLDGEGKTITVIAEYTASKPTDAEERSFSSLGQTISLSDFPDAADALNRGRPVQAQTDAPSHEQAHPDLHETQAMLLLPMVAHGHTTGLAAVRESQRSRRFTQGEIAMGQTLTHQAAIAMEHSRLFLETQQAAQRIEALYQTSRALASSLEEESLMHTILEAVYRTLNCEYVLIATVDESARTIKVQHGILRGELDACPEWVRTTERSLDDPGVLADVYRTGQTEIITEWDQRFDREVWEIFDQQQVLRIVMPIQMRDQTIGVVEVGYDKGILSRRDEQVGPDKVQMLTAFMDQAAVALENARLFEEAARRVRAIEFLHDVSLAAATEMHLQDTLQRAAEALAAQIEDSRVALLLLESDSSVLRLAAGVGYPSELIGTLCLKLGEGISGWVAQYGRPVIVPDVRLEPRYYEVDPEIRSELCVPLTAGPFIIGALSVSSPQVNAFVGDDQRLMSTLASNLAVLVERVRLFNEVEAAQAELEQRAQALEEANARLQELDRLKDQFLANMSHELRTPLNSIIGFSEVLIKGQMGEMSGNQQQCVENILASGEHLLTLINDILDLSKIEAGRMSLEPTTFFVSELLAEVKTTVSPLVGRKSQQLVIELADDLPPLSADRFRVKQVLLNLLSNANKFAPVSGRITMSCRLADSDTMIFSVIDTGPGIRAEDQKIIFERFGQAQGPLALPVTGTGLGLAISKRLIEMHGNRMWVESEYGHGATFSFLLPVHGPTTQEISTEPTPDPENRRVLVVEDDYQFSNLLALYLRQEGYVPIQHYSGAGVLERAHEVRPTLITLDIMLPDKSGWDVLRAIKADPQTRDIPVLVVTVVEDSNLAFSLGATDFIVKPLRLEELQVLLNRLMTRQPSTDGTKILIVEDDPEMVLLVRAMLPAEGCTVLSAYDGDEGLTLARDERPDVILLDLMLPEMSGFEVLDRLRADPQTEDIPVIVLTAKDVTADERELLDHYIQGMMSKTALTPQSLLAQLRRLERACS